MPPTFGSAPTCPRCLKPVYFAEQTLGPGGVAFHKLCLKCTACGRLLEPRLLVDHEGEAYCKACHGKAFGAKGYGAGGALIGEYAPSPSATSPASASPSRPRPAPPSKPDFDEDDTRDSPLNLSNLVDVVPRIVPRASVPPPPPSRLVQAEPERGEKFTSTPAFDEEKVRQTPSSPPPSVAPLPPPVPVASSSPPKTRTALPRLAPKPKPPTLAPKPAFSSPNTASAPATSVPSAPPAPPPRPAIEPSASAAPSPAPAPNTLRTIPLSTSSSAYASPPRLSPAVTSGSRNKDLCPRCNTVVYFAEEVRAVGAKWHKRCLRCSSCSTTLSPNTLTEKEGQPYCKKCYGDKWGLGGLGVASRPGLY